MLTYKLAYLHPADIMITGWTWRQWQQKAIERSAPEAVKTSNQNVSFFGTSEKHKKNGRGIPEKINNWNPNMEVWKRIFLFNWVIFRLHVNF